LLIISSIVLDLEIELEMDKCSICGNRLDKKDFRKYAIKISMFGIILFPILLVISYGTIIPFLTLAIFMGIGLWFLLKKDRYFYFCNRCKIKFKHTTVPTL
jgi:hypothetical protein